MILSSTRRLLKQTSHSPWVMVMATGLTLLVSCTQSSGGSCGDNEVLRGDSCVSKNQQSQNLSALLLDAGLTKRDLSNDNLRLDDGTLKVTGDSFVVNTNTTKLSEALGDRSAIVAFYFSGGYQKDESGVMQTWAKHHAIKNIMESCHGKTKAPHVLAAAVSVKDGALVIKFLEDLVDHHKGIKEIIKGGNESFVAAKVSESPSVFPLRLVTSRSLDQPASIRNYRTKDSQQVEVLMHDIEEDPEIEMTTLKTNGKFLDISTQNKIQVFFLQRKVCLQRQKFMLLMI